MADRPNYLDEIAAAIGTHVPNCPVELLRIYAVLALTRGVNTTREDVHHAWSAWQTATRPDHQSLVLFDQLSPEVQALDQPYVDAIHKVAQKVFGFEAVSRG